MNDIAPYEALGAADILITDYSSCFFDYLVLDRPIIHFIYDYENYKNIDRGIYYEKEEVICGDAVENICNLKKSIKKYVMDPEQNKDLRQKRRNQYIEYENPNSCEIIFNEIYKASRQEC